jgi:histidinol-phosphate aminotransferase
MYHKKTYLSDLKRIRAGSSIRDISSGILLDRNERTIPFSGEITKLLHEKLANINLGLYPEMPPFYEKLSNWLNVKNDEIYITEGVSGAIKSLVETLTIPGLSNVVFPYPTFALYKVYCEMFNVKPILINYHSDYKLNYEELIRSINEDTAIVFLPNPNVPIHGTIELDKIKSLAELCMEKNVLLALDEVYYPFSTITGIKLIYDFSNVLVMRSFSKAFGLAGIRLGYMIGNNDIIDYVSKTRTGYESNSISIEIASFFIDNYTVILDYVQEVKEGLDFLKSELDTLNIENNGGYTGNNIFINLKDEALVNNIVKSLSKKNIYVRGDWPYPYNCGISVTGGPKLLMRNFFNEFKSTLKKHE